LAGKLTPARGRRVFAAGWIIEGVRVEISIIEDAFLPNGVIRAIDLRGAQMKKLVFLLFLVIAVASATVGQTGPPRTAGVWKFAVSGDSRNCGDVVMPSIAYKVREDGAAFYWHLGDYRAIYDFDQNYKARNPNVSILQYETDVWPDFIQRQLTPFGDVPVYLGLGNHETIPPKTRTEAIAQFADWRDTSELRTERLRDDPNDHLVSFTTTGFGEEWTSSRSTTLRTTSLTMLRWPGSRRNSVATRKTRKCERSLWECTKLCRRASRPATA
jgi:hypothetical protein